MHDHLHFTDEFDRVALGANTKLCFNTIPSGGAPAHGPVPSPTPGQVWIDEHYTSDTAQPPSDPPTPHIGAGVGVGVHDAEQAGKDASDNAQPTADGGAGGS